MKLGARRTAAPWRSLLLGVLLSGSAAQAEVTIGLTLSTTGPAASLGIPARNTVALLPTRIGGHDIRYIVLDDASDPGTAQSNARRLISGQVDAIVGSSNTPNALAMIDTVAESGTPMLALASSSRVVEPMDARRAWVFKTPQGEAQMATAIAEHMRSRRVERIAFIGFADAYGESWWSALSAAIAGEAIAVVARTAFRPGETSVAAQVEQIIAARPEAVLVAASGTPAALPQKALRNRGYSGLIYQTHGAASGDFIRVGGKDVEGTFLPAGPVLVAAQLNSDNPVRKAAREYSDKYEARHGKGSVSAFGAHLWDAGLLLQRAIPEALKKAHPGTRAFRAALRDALEGVRDLAGLNGVFNMSDRDHGGIDRRGSVMLTIDKGLWKLVQ